MNSISTNSATKITSFYFLTCSIVLSMCEPPIGYGAPNQDNYNNYNSNSEYDDYSSYEHSTTTTEPQSYEFGYKVKDDYSGSNFHQQESSDGNQVKGEYRVALPDGRTQIVTYWADWKSGFHANVRYEGEVNYQENNNGVQQQQQHQHHHQQYQPQEHNQHQQYQQQEQHQNQQQFQHYGPPNIGSNGGYNYHNPNNQ